MNISASNPQADGPGGATDGPRLLAAGMFHMGPDLSAHEHRLDSAMFEFFLNGRLDIRAGGRDWRPVAQGQGVLYPPNTPFYERLADPQQRCTSFSLFFDDGQPPLLGRFLDSKRPWWVADPDGELRRLIDTIQRADSPGQGNELLRRGCFCQLIALIARGQMRGETLVVRSGEADEPDFISRAHRFMRKHLAKPVRVADLARHTGYSESGFAHAYRSTMGQSPMADLRRMRIDAACALLCRKHMTLDAIAAQTGFADAFHLSRSFKQVVGVPPSRYRAASNPQ